MKKSQIKKLQIFVSSTYEDLKDERQDVVEAILTAGHIPAGMELFCGAGKVINIIKKWINESDIYFLLLGGKYGSLYEEDAEKESISYTEWEYEYAKYINKPICVIMLSNYMLHGKAQKIGEEKVFEKENKEKYDKFKEKVISDGFFKKIDNISQISGVVQADITSVIENGDYNLIGWVKADETLADFNKMKNEALVEICQEVLDTYISRYYLSTDMTDFSKIIGRRILRIVNADGVLDSFHRIVKISHVKESNIKVTIADEYVYRYLDSKHHAFGKRFHTTKQQAYSYKIEKLLINNDDYTKDFELEITENANRGQLNYCVKSKKSIPLGNKFPANIYYVCSYECPVLDFFQGFGLPFPCKNFMVDIYLEDMLDEKYTIVTSTNSLFSREYSDSFESYEIRNFIGCSIRLPEWSLPSDGYVATMKKKSENNH